MGPKIDKKKEEQKAQKPAQEQEKSMVEAITFVIALFLVCAYGGYLYDKTAFEQYSTLKPLVTLFEKIDQFSPFMEFLEDDNWATEKKSDPKVIFQKS